MRKETTKSRIEEIIAEIESRLNLPQHGNPYFGSESVQAYRDALENMQSDNFPEYIKQFR